MAQSCYTRKAAFPSSPPHPPGSCTLSAHTSSGFPEPWGATLFLLSVVSLVWLPRFHPSHTDQSNRTPIQMEGETTSKAARSILHCSTSVTCGTECRLLVSRLQQSKQIHFSHSLHATQVGDGCTQGRLNYTEMYVSSKDQSISVSCNSCCLSLLLCQNVLAFVFGPQAGSLGNTN